MHILVRAEPISLVAPGNTKSQVHMTKPTEEYSTYTCSYKELYAPRKAVISIYATANSVLCKVKAAESIAFFKQLKTIKCPFTFSRYLHKTQICL